MNLERSSDAYRAGYWHAVSQQYLLPLATQLGMGVFGVHDYREGLKAGANDQHWRLVDRGDLCDICTRRCGPTHNRAGVILHPVSP